MSDWQELYDSGKFSINTDEPSELVMEVIDQFPANSRIVDIGCGAGRNAVFLASRGFEVDASDIVDLGWHQSLPPTLRDRISFKVASAADIGAWAESYDAVLMMRLLQYLSPEELASLTAKVSSSLILGGLAIASFTTGEISQTVTQAVPVFKHLPEDVVRGFERQGLQKTMLRQFRTVSKHVPFYSEVDVCELVLRK